MENLYDVLILGGGVAGMTAGIYAKRRGKKVAIIEKYTLGGQVVALNKIANFPSQSLIDGFSLSQMFSKQVKEFEIEIIADDIKNVDLTGETKMLEGKKQYQAKSVIIATGLSSVELGVNESEFLGRGVSYCAICDANFYKNRPVCVASSKGSGIKAALELAEVCENVKVLDSADMSVYAQANKNPKIEVLSNVKIERVLGEEVVKSLQIKQDGKEQIVETNALFVELGKVARTDLFEGLKKDEKGFIFTDEKMQTSIPNVFAVGDVRAGVIKQIVTACADGAIAGQFA